MDSHLLKKISKCDTLELLYWLSSCQLESSGKPFLLEYAISVVLSLGYHDKIAKRKLTRELVQFFINNAMSDINKIMKSAFTTDSLTQFLLPYLVMRGEAYTWQYAKASRERYGAHSEWMLKNLGFTIEDAIEFTLEISKMVMLRYPYFPLGLKKPPKSEDSICVPQIGLTKYWRDKITLPEKEIRAKVKEDKKERLIAYLDKISFTLEELHNSSDPMNFNILYEKPLLRTHDSFVPLIPTMLWHVIAKTFHYDFLKDERYIERYIAEKGLSTERRVVDCLTKLFPEERVQSRIHYNPRKGNPDIDVIADFGPYILFFECSAKWISLAAKRGDQSAIIEDLQKSIVKCSKQLERGTQAYLGGRIPDLSQGKLVIPIIVLDDRVFHLEFALRQWRILGAKRPFVISIDDLDILSEISNKQEFVNFVIERGKIIDRAIYAANEVEYLLFYRNVGFEKGRLLAKQTAEKEGYIISGEFAEYYPYFHRDHLLAFLNDPVITRIVASGEIDLLTPL